MNNGTLSNQTDIFKQIYDIQQKGLTYAHEMNPKYLLCIAGPMCAGKSRVAKFLEEELKAIRFSNDEARYIYTEQLKYKEPLDIMQYVAFAMKNLLTLSNHLIILDASIDRVYNSVLQFAEKIQFPVFTVSVDTDVKILLERLKKRNETDEEGFDKLVTEEAFYVTVEEHKAFLAQYKPDITITDTNENDLKQVVDLLKQKLSMSV
ncbi:AAA family ATPase [bacterium]|nr:AAA family ATPase [bacterium]